MNALWFAKVSKAVNCFKYSFCIAALIVGIKSDMRVDPAPLLLSDPTYNNINAVIEWIFLIWID